MMETPPGRDSVRRRRIRPNPAIRAATRNFPNYGVPRDVYLTRSPWTIENGTMTPTLKLKRRIILANLEKEIDELYAKRGE